MTEIPLKVARSLTQIFRREVDPIIQERDYNQLASLILAQADLYSTHYSGTVIYDNPLGLSICLNYSITPVIKPQLVTTDELGNKLYDRCIENIWLDVKDVTISFLDTTLKSIGNFSASKLEQILKDNILL